MTEPNSVNVPEGYDLGSTHEHETSFCYESLKVSAWLAKQEPVRSGEYVIKVAHDSMARCMTSIHTSSTGYCIGFTLVELGHNPRTRYYLRNHTQGDYREVSRDWWRKKIRENFRRWK